MQDERTTKSEANIFDEFGKDVCRIFVGVDPLSFVLTVLVGSVILVGVLYLL